MTLEDCTFVAPAGWNVERHADHVRLQNPGSGCLILIVQPQQSSGDLEQDAKAVFDAMYASWQYQKSGEQHHTMSKGHTPQGLEYCLMEAAMSTTTADDRYHLEDGAALVIKGGDPIVIVGARHNSSMFAHDQCTKYEGWPRFLASFTVKNVRPSVRADPEASLRIVGRWTMSESRASGEYLFAANGQYRFSGAIGSTYTTSGHDYDILHMTTSAFEGDGSYSISGNQLSMRRHGDDTAEQVPFRFEQGEPRRTGVGGPAVPAEEGRLRRL